MRDAGFSLLEATIAAALATAVAGSVFAMLQTSKGLPAAAPETADMQQRLRVAVDALTRDLTVAGAGAYIGDPSGPLIRSFPPVLPFRQGLNADDPPGVVRPDTVTILSVPSTAAQAALATPLARGAVTLQASAGAACGAGTNLCGFAAGMTVALYDDRGAFDTFVVASVDDAAAQLTLLPSAGSTAAYAAGSRVVQVRIDMYSIKIDAATQTGQLMHGDGSANADVPVVDHLVALAFDYADAVSPLSAARFGDGPWRPDEGHANRWDADLLSIRAVGVTLRVEAALAALRGPAGVLFTNPGSARAAWRWAPDQEIRVQLSPRNMNLEAR